MDETYGVHFIIVRTNRDYGRDSDEWIGIYDNIFTIKSHYEAEKIRLSREKLMNKHRERNRFRKKCHEDHREVTVYAFDELSGKWTYDVDLNDPYTEAISGRLTQEEINYLLGAEPQIDDTESEEE